MAKKLRTVKAALRVGRGKGPASRARRAGRVPAVIYGRGSESRPLELDRGEMEKLVSRGERLVKLEIEGEPSQAMVKEVQYEPVSRLISHVDFMEISATSTITIEVPVRLRGTPAGAAEGGVLDAVMHAIEVECRPADVPEEIRLDVSKLQIGDGIRAREIELPPGLKLVTGENSTVVALEHPRSEEDSEAQVVAAEGGTGPEVITGKKEEGAEEEAAAPAEEPKAPPEKASEGSG